ncbi:hypothetical protein LTR91_025191 [Friedmanniomyces endolithicus]|uniref:MAPEG family protein n=1 Tax=Friedmanniomyces endolithicus TaxID=329885 RepID=A0AAN6JWT0_9PEZI|nr:hypothetical protein LTR94_020910 [Friedmanniomyces endolithicus]KAK0788730.1 hypothetical protein LTR59_009924 [Friedmanniomyces endolithicus]KAK0806612.1 hypothetical protein LTR75_006938 [Friedmanniomyces endolithicus]KAK0817488.1 hypothetical protein LTR38_001566 [Friedmanniomyces endolithicus]KAK0833470.1 hypothetical protein LTR03_014742 [Friedmanniomyces endolithicus]
MPFNVPLLTIALYYVLAQYPHGHAVWVATHGNVAGHDNRNPQASSVQANFKRSLTEREYAAWERAESCHRNHLENMPLLVAAVFAGLLAENQIGSRGEVGLTAFCVGWMAIRVLYTANYLTTETQGWSYVRSGLYFAGTLWAMSVLGRAAWVLGS